MRIYTIMKKKICVLLLITFFLGNTREVVMGTTLEDISITEQSTEFEGKETISVTELDLGDYTDTMLVGERQLISVTCLPLNATETNLIYASSNPEVADINGMGRISAIAVGTTTISVSCGNICESFFLQVLEESETIIPVVDIEIGNHENKVDVGKTIALSTTVLPSDATNSTVTYKSSDESIATVNSSGEVKGVSKGNVIIYVSAGNITKEIPITVQVATTGIKVNSDYLVLKPGKTFQLSGSVIPLEANQMLFYRSLDESIVSVTYGGLVTANKEGNTTIVVSNGDSSVAVSVIVNKTTLTENEASDQVDDIEVVDKYNNSVKSSEIEKIDADALYYLYSTETVLKIIGDGYKIEIDGKNIVNYKNEFYTDINLVRGENEITFNLNSGNFLCGEVTVCIHELEGKYLYLYNTSKEKYEMIQIDSLEELKLTTPGEYKITNQRIIYDSMTIIWFFIFGGVAIIIGVGVYIVLKKKYWFW